MLLFTALVIAFLIGWFIGFLLRPLFDVRDYGLLPYEHDERIDEYEN